jgi:hypothetical protein
VPVVITACVITVAMKTSTVKSTLMSAVRPTLVVAVISVVKGAVVSILVAPVVRIMSRCYLVSHAQSGLDMKLIGDTGAVIIKIPAAYVEGFLLALKA